MTMDSLIEKALYGLLGVAHPMSVEAAWAAKQLADQGIDTGPGLACAGCGHPRFQHGRNLCHVAACACLGRGALGAKS